MLAKGTFDIKLNPIPDDVPPVGRMIISKEYSGDMVGTGSGQMISKRTASGTAVYSAIEEFEGTVNGKKGSFTFLHIGEMSSSHQSLEITIVAGSGTSEFEGISGSISIEQENSSHSYELDYSL
tara:strand:- start:35786 stop:36157 length:372 start_codon:yes stop_codon:yes gene_type:complete